LAQAYKKLEDSTREVGEKIEKEKAVK